MNDNTKQSDESDLKMISKIVIKHKPPKFEQEKHNNAEVGYVHKILEKVVKDLNDTFMPQLDSRLEENKNSLEKEKDRIDGLVNNVGDSNTGLIKNLNDLQQEVKNLESKKSSGDDVDINGEWLSVDTGLITI